MKVVMTGGGSGGHITPILAVAHELKQLRPDAEIIYIGQRGDKLLDVPTADPNIDVIHTVSAGKLRRYSDEGWRQLLDIRSQALNIRDLFRIIAGIWQSFWLIRKLKPEVIFTRGGFVSVPVALGGLLNHVPYITHDADSVPSLANRLIARWARFHAVALPIELYPYPKSKTIMVGIPVSRQYESVTPALQTRYRQEIAVPAEAQVVFVTGGGNGAQRLNRAVVENAAYLLTHYPKLVLVHVTGRALEAETNTAYDALDLKSARSRVVVAGFVHDLYRYSGAADVVVARGGATNLAEFSIQAKACIIVPSTQLGWNVKNSQALADRQAVVQLNEEQAEQPERLGRCIGDLLDNAQARVVLGQHLAELARPDSAKELAELLVTLQSGKDDGVRT
jgi:UDP-N-acetylglucosamine--N-acetylmuramyl-(pentapeptide) pyrophosphoryl-undecaprenol N-acetylglucosamine transferase